jgi:hypothetical protein
MTKVVSGLYYEDRMVFCFFVEVILCQEVYTSSRTVANNDFTILSSTNTSNALLKILYRAKSFAF